VITGNKGFNTSKGYITEDSKVSFSILPEREKRS
jgi:hypothetical protein